MTEKEKGKREPGQENAVFVGRRPTMN